MAEERGQDDTNLIRQISSWIVDIAVACSLAWFCMHCFGTRVTVVGQSMTPTFQSGDVVLMNRLVYDIGKPHIGDIVVFERDDHKRNIKRVVGMPGDVVQITDGKLLVNGAPFEAEGMPGAVPGQVAFAGIAENPVELGEEEYFLLGDNRDNSEDSRFEHIGNIRERQILGKVWLRVYPLPDMGMIRE